MANKRTKTEQPLTPEIERKLAIKAYKERIRYARRKGLTPYEITQFEDLQTEDINALRGERLFEQPSWLNDDTDDVFSDYDSPPLSSNLNTQIIAEISSILVQFDIGYVTAVYSKSWAKHKQKIADFLTTIWTNNLSEYDDDQYELAYRLENNAEEFKDLTSHLLYDSESITQESINIRRWVELLYGGTLDAITAGFISDIADTNNLAFYG